MTDILSQDEIDALLHGVDSGEVITDDVDALSDPDASLTYDFLSQDRIVRGRMPTLEAVCERFALGFESSLLTMFRCNADVSAGGVQLLKFSDLADSLVTPTSIAFVQFEPLRGTGLVTFSPTLVHAFVDVFFGGRGTPRPSMGERAFSETENRIASRMLGRVLDELAAAWDPVLEIRPNLKGSEVNPQFVNVLAPSEVVVVAGFHVELQAGSGELHLVMPYSMLEPIKELLGNGIQTERGRSDERWLGALEHEVFGAEVQLACALTSTDLSLRALASLDVGDVIPIEMPEFVVARAEDIPIFRASFGTSGQNFALKVRDFVEHPTQNTVMNQIQIARARRRDAVPQSPTTEDANV